MIKIVDGGRYACPVCGELSIYVHAMDVLFHVSGSDNWDCWAAVTRGEVDPDMVFEPWVDCDCANREELKCQHGLYWPIQTAQS